MAEVSNRRNWWQDSEFWAASTMMHVRCADYGAAAS
jgi:hypothetical protein